jgi:uncharacterized integral membrane protein
MNHIALVLDILFSSFAFGATIWFFFVQSPALLKWMGKEKFIPIQMRMTKVLFKALSVAVPLAFAMSMVHSRHVFWLHVVTLGAAMFGALFNAFVVVPRALKAGGKALKDVRSGEEEASDSVADFASVGGGEASKTWHRLVVVFVVVMLGGLFGHGAVMLHHPPKDEEHTHEAAEHDHAPEAAGAHDHAQ